jgi:hypothetical protein
MRDTMSDHPVKKKLRNDILPYLITAKHLNDQWFCRTHRLFGYTTDILVALTALGLIPAVIANIFGNNPNDTPTKVSELEALLPKEFHYLYYMMLVLVLAWVILRVAFNQEDGQKRAVLARSCSLSMRHAESKLPHLLGNADPMPGITELYDTSIYPIVDRNIQELPGHGFHLHPASIAKSRSSLPHFVLCTSLHGYLSMIRSVIKLLPLSEAKNDK